MTDPKGEAKEAAGKRRHIAVAGACRYKAELALAAAPGHHSVVMPDRVN